MSEKIGVFDSGIGGLTVMRALRGAFPKADMIYLGDVARVPYGGRSVATITKYALDDAGFLMDRGVSLLITACNTVSAASLPVLKERYPVPVYGMIDSAAREAVSVTRNGRIGVIGTQATVNSGAYEIKIKELMPEALVLSQACPLFVPLIENGIGAEDPVARMVAERYLNTFEGYEIDTLIMGCTHYPVYEHLFRTMMPGVELVNTGNALAKELTGIIPENGSGCVEYYVTERSAAFHEIVRIMDPSVSPETIRVDNSFIR